MKLEDYNDKAKEAFAKSLIDIGVAIFKSMILTIMVLPVTLIVKTTIDGGNSEISVIQILSSMSGITYATFLSFIIFAFFSGYYFRKEGLKILNTIDEPAT